MASRRATVKLISLNPALSASFRPLASVSFLPKFCAPRKMSTEANPRKFEWLVVIPDLPGVLDQRLAVRPKHFEGMKPFVESGQWKMGGALLDEVPKDDDPASLKMSGSTLVAVASSREEIMEVLKADPYAKEGVWDLEKVQMWPFKCAFRNP
ncbi:hypothetical protein PpBr36_03028 [Pyricularia pennisetigena]|uniref:hypothetical protein n=1 Tax=Pyricularia pennisetigena TaxID=1578925 RepID=UPI0011514DC6|nr:hypothetical protein PpBr36_03028 [Pyricularia pennisetigena]TLS31116.1 hypothetical protein PpBr36_03028 [Pyricularia pennisetigena]